MGNPEKKPEKMFRIGSVSASVFVNEVDAEGGGKRQIRNVNLQRRYHDDKEDKWKSSSSFGLSDLLNAQRVLQLATAYVESHEAHIQP